MPPKEDDVVGPGWAVMHNRRPYFPRTFHNKVDAELALFELLDIYPPGNEWHKKLYVGWYGGTKAPVRFKPPYGYRYRESNHGTMLVSHPYEQNIIVLIKRMLGHYSLKEIARKLNDADYTNRKREKFKSDYIQAILDDLPTERRQK